MLRAVKLENKIILNSPLSTLQQVFMLGFVTPRITFTPPGQGFNRVYIPLLLDGIGNWDALATHRMVYQEMVDS